MKKRASFAPARIVKMIDDDNARDKMSIFLRVLPRFLQKFILRYITGPVILVVSIVFFLIIVPIAVQSRIKEPVYGINNIFLQDPRYRTLIRNTYHDLFSPLSIQYRKSLLTSFVPYVRENRSKCIDRKKYGFEFVRLLGIDPYKHNLSSNHVLVVGNSNYLGDAIVQNLRKANVQTISIGCENDIDFSSPDSMIPFQNISVTHAFVTCTPNYISYSMSDGSKSLKKSFSKYIQGLFSFLDNRSISFVYSTDLHVDDDILQIGIDFGGKIVRFPMLIDERNSISRAAKECKVTNRSTYETNEFDSILSDITSEEAAQYLVSEMNKSSLDYDPVMVEGTKSMSVFDSLEKLKKESCMFSITPSRHSRVKSNISYKIEKLIGKPNIIDSFLDQTIVLEKERKPYLSIVIVGRHDNFSGGFEDRSQVFFDNIGKAKEKYPLANFEIIYVDYATEASNTPMSTVLDIPESLRGYVKFIIVPPKVHSNLKKKMNSSMGFFEYIAKNIGIRRSKGEYILATNPDDIISPFFFSFIEREEFNPFTLYQSIRWDTRDNTFVNATLDDLINATNEPWKLKEFDVKQRCHIDSLRFSIMDSVTKFNEHSVPCAAGDFLLLSKKMWEIVGGFNEYPANPNVDAVFLSRIMKLINGYPRYILSSIVLHQKHAKKNVFRPAINNHHNIIDEYSCVGESKTLGKFNFSPNWGLSEEQFEEIIL